MIHVAYVGSLTPSGGYLGFVYITDGVSRLALNDRKNNILFHHSLCQNLHPAAVHHSIRGAPGKCLSLYCAHSTLDQCGILYHYHVPLYFSSKQWIPPD